MAVEGHEGKVQAKMTHEFSAWATEWIAEILLIESYKGKWKGVASERGNGMEAKRKKSFKDSG